MLIELKIKNFRNISMQKLSFENKKNVVFIGKNGQGKTNILESIYLLSFGSSFRTKNKKDLIQYGFNSLVIDGNYLINNIVTNVKYKIDDDICKVLIADKLIYDRKELIKLFPCVLFAHHDISFINGEQQIRRWFFDQVLSLTNNNYIDDLRSFNKILRARNLMLNGNNKVLEIIDEQFIEYGLKIQNERTRIFHSINSVINEYYSNISEDKRNIKVNYIPNWGQSKEDIRKILIKTREKEQIIGYSISGPQRDKINFFDGNNDFLKIASTGQVRLLALCLRLCQGKLFTDATNRLPIFLIDDALLELDENKQAKFINLLPNYEQAFFTFLPQEAKLIDQGVKKYLTINGTYE